MMADGATVARWDAPVSQLSERHPKLSPRFGIEPIASVGEVTGTSQSLPADLGTPPWPGLFAQLRGSEVP